MAHGKCTRSRAHYGRPELGVRYKLDIPEGASLAAMKLLQGKKEHGDWRVFPAEQAELGFTYELQFEGRPYRIGRAVDA